jgi:hypothetical protein
VTAGVVGLLLTVGPREGEPIGSVAAGDKTLFAGIGQRDVSPDIEPFVDDNKNKVWDVGEAFTDKNGNGVFDAYWMAGYGNGRLATSVHDPVWARAVVLRQQAMTVAVVSVDSLGLFYEETGEVEALLKAQLGAKYDLDLLLLHATHLHQAPDLVGGWGPNEVTSGIHPGYRQQVRQGIVDAVKDALAQMKPVRVTAGSVPVADPVTGDMTRYVGDSRDPVVIDNVLHTLQFLDLSSVPAKPLATLVNWAHHPEAVGSSNQAITSDFVHFLREKMEAAGSGPVIYISGALGGQIGPGRVVPVNAQGMPVPKHSFEKAELIGKTVADFALMAMADTQAVSIEGKDADLRFRVAKFKAQIENSVYHLAGKLGIYKRTLCCYDVASPIDENNLPWVESKIAYLTLGPVAILTNPGELLPELFIGGYGGEYKGTYRFIDTTKPNPPDVSKAPPPPYLIERMDGMRAHRMTFGLTMDFLGYIVPRYNFVLDEQRPYFDEAEGDHYEETNSIGSLAEPHIVGAMRQLVLSARPVAVP